MWSVTDDGEVPRVDGRTLDGRCGGRRRGRGRPRALRALARRDDARLRRAPDLPPRASCWGTSARPSSRPAATATTATPATASPTTSTDEDAPFATGERVHHPEFGDGTVQAIEDGIVTVVFDRVGYKTLSEEIIVRRGLV